MGNSCFVAMIHDRHDDNFLAVLLLPRVKAQKYSGTPGHMDNI